MVWAPGCDSPIHDHREWCVFGVLSGCLRETRYVPAGETEDGPLARPTRTLTHRAGAVTHLPVVAPSIHRISNPGRDPVLSLHVYGGDCRKQGPNVDRIYRLKG